MSGFSGDVVTVDATTDEGWYLSAIAVTGAEATGFKFMFTGSDVTALGEYTDVGFPVTYLADEHVHLTGDPIYIPGQSGITLDSGYDTYYRISGYEIDNGEIVDGVLIPSGPCTIKAVEKINYFTATGNFDKGSNVVANGNNAGDVAAYNTKWIYANVPEKYALYVNHTGDISTSWYANSNRWNPSDASAYSITLNAIVKFTAGTVGSYPKGRAATAVTMLGSTSNSQQTFSRADGQGSNTWNYNKTVTTTAQNILYGISGRVGGSKYKDDMYRIATTNATYVATGTTGTWTATGIAP
jgi:hypothetical protein